MHSKWIEFVSHWPKINIFDGENNMKKMSFALALSLTTALSSQAFAADVPAGTQLAEDQTYTYRVLDEFASLDPQLNEETAGFHVIRDLFEGLISQDADGNLVPGVKREPGWYTTETLIMRSKTGSVRRINYRTPVDSD